MRRTASSLGVVLALGLFGCEKEEPRDRSAEPAASIDRAAAVDPALAKAMAQASAASKRGPAAAADGPPANGVFEPGAADREARLGAPPKVTLGERGAEPRVALGPIRPKPGWKTAGSIQITMQQAGQGGLPVKLGLTLEAQKAKLGDGGADAPSGATADLVAITARVKSAEVSVAGAPDEVASRVRALKGARVDYQVAPDGSGTAYHYDLPSAATDAVDIVRILLDTLALVTLPVPDVPLGQGGFWMATSREGIYGLDLVTYRMIKVEKLAGDSVTLSVGTKRYATSNRFDFAGLPADAPRDLLEFDAKSDGRLEFTVGSPFPHGGEIGSLLSATLGKPPQVGRIQIQSRVNLAFPDKPGGAVSKPVAAPKPAQAPDAVP